MFEPTYTFVKIVKEEESQRFIPPNEEQNNNIIIRNNIVKNFTYREYLIDNSKKVMDKNRELYKHA